MIRKWEIRIYRWLARYGFTGLRIGLAIVYFWFGFIKFFPGWSPGEALAGKTMNTLSLGALSPEGALMLLAVWESFIGIGLLINKWQRFVLISLMFQMIGTLSVFVIYPEDTFIVFPFALSLVGQYIFKNLIFISAGIFIGATLRGQAIARNPEHLGKV